jgi:hypothetical protein
MLVKLYLPNSMINKVCTVLNKVLNLIHHKNNKCISNVIIIIINVKILVKIINVKIYAKNNQTVRRIRI